MAESIAGSQEEKVYLNVPLRSLLGLQFSQILIPLRTRHMHHDAIYNLW